MSDTPRVEVSRRGFLKGAGLTAATTVLDTATALAHDAQQAVKGNTDLGPDAVPIKLHVNGQEHAVTVEPRYTLAETLREHLNLTGTKVACDRGSCSACTVWVDGAPQLACMTLAVDAVGHKITTIEGLSHGEQLHPVQAAFIKHDALQCGFCTPGMVMSCAALLQRNPHPTLAEVKHAVSGNLCRCGTYPKVVAATLDVAQHGTKVARLLELNTAEEGGL
jgi:xanthine dehydrogenase YagT iron-sulfur-binding subunit